MCGKNAHVCKNQVEHKFSYVMFLLSVLGGRERSRKQYDDGGFTPAGGKGGLEPGGIEKRVTLGPHLGWALGLGLGKAT